MHKEIINASLAGKIIVALLALSGTLSLAFWLQVRPAMQLDVRIPGMDNAGSAETTQGSRTGPEGALAMFGGIPSTITTAWPSFRGADLSNISEESYQPVPPDSPLNELWSLELGEGHAGAAVHGGRVYVMDYDRENKADAFRCFSLDDGSEIWRYSYPVNIKRNHGMSRTIPYVTDDVAVSIGPKCHVTCLDSKSGEKKWSLDLVVAYGAEIPPWYAGQCPIIDQGRLLLAPGGRSLMAALEPATGETIWETPNPNNWKMTHTSIMPMELNGRRMYIYSASRGVVGVSAEDGKILWEYPEWKISIANVPSPLVIGDGRIFFCGGYDAGSMMLRVSEKEGEFIAEEVFRLPPEQFGSAQQTPILMNGSIYGVRPDGQLVCLDLDGNEQWASGSAHKFGMGPYLIAGDVLYVMNDHGLLSRVEAKPDQFALIDQHEALQGHDSWGPMAFVSGRLILRDMTRMVCLQAAQ